MKDKKLKNINLPVYKDSYELLLYSFDLIKNLNREFKYTLGEKIRDELVSLLMNVFKANKLKNRTEKLTLVEVALQNIELVRLLFRLLFDLKQINMKQLVCVNVNIETVRRQLIGWCQSLT